MRYLFGFALLLILSCSVNIYEPLVSDDSDKGLIEKAENQIDEQDYSGALSTLDSISGDSNEKRILQVASLLGASGFDMWQIILDVLDSKSGGQQLGFDNLFDSLSGTVFGDDERDARVRALADGIDLLLNAPDTSDSDLQNLNCFLGGVLSIVAVDDANSALGLCDQA